MATSDELERLQELTFRVVLRAVGERGTGAILSLAGGRKTMSADLQRAGSIFGCTGLLHVVVPEPFPKGLRQLESEPDKWVEPLPDDLAEGLAPAFLGRHGRMEALDIEPEVAAERFPLPRAEGDGTPCVWGAAQGEASLVKEVDRREREGNRLLGNFLGELAQGEPHEGWRTLYRLPPRTVAALRRTPLTDGNHNWLVRLPKADLHRHIGGCLDLEAQRRVGRAVWEALTPREREAAHRAVADLLATAPAAWPWEWPAVLTAEAGDRPSLRSHRAACLLVEVGEGLAEALFGATEPRLALSRSARGFAAYERPGELTGSAILQHEAAIAPYAAALVAQARAEGLAYVELRGSPQKYLGGDGPRFLRLLRDALKRAGAQVNGGDGESAEAAVAAGEARRPWFRFVVIADRHHWERAEEVVTLAVEALL